jgi:hypothetical protein
MVNQKVLQRMLIRMGYGREHIATVDNGQKGLDEVVEAAGRPPLDNTQLTAATALLSSHAVSSSATSAPPLLV